MSPSMVAKASHPSNRLYHGEVASLKEALVLLQQEYETEARAFSNNEDSRRRLDCSAAKARHLFQEYSRTVREAEDQLVENWKESIDPEIREWASALASGDYAALAI